MLKILLVDDDVFYRTTFINLIHWEDFGCSISFQADNGQQAIQILNEQTIDIIISDISMPILNGVELIKHVGRHFPHIKCLVLSSFDDFEYVRESMKYGALDYILKHTLTKDTLTGIVKSFSADSFNAKTLPHNPQSLQKQIANTIIFDLLSQNILLPKGYTFKEIFMDYSLESPAYPFASVIIRLENVLALNSRYENQEEYRQFFNMVISISQTSAENYGDVCCFSNYSDFIYIIISNQKFNSMLFFLNTMHSIHKHISDTLKRFLNIDVLISSSDLYNDAACLAICIQNGLNNLKNQTNHDILEEQRNKTTIITINLEVEQRVIDAMLHKELVQVNEIISCEFEKQKICNNEKNTLQHLAIEFINIINKICRTKAIPLHTIYGENTSPYSVILEIHSYRELVDYTLTRYSELYKSLCKIPETDNNIVQRAIHYINLHYTQAISLSSASEYINCNSAYLSRIFKNELGVNFIQYLTDYRIKRAVDLLDNNTHTIKEIATRVGFENYNYFFTVFKKTTGLTPQEYLKKGS